MIFIFKTAFSPHFQTGANTPQTWYAAVLKSLSVSLFFCFIFMRHTIVKEVFPPLWGVLPL
jgi:hypothetical protein